MRGGVYLPLRPCAVLGCILVFAVALLLPLFQIIAALGIFNVWLFRAAQPTAYRGGGAKNMREEFQAYGLPFWFMCVVGALKLSLAATLLLALWWPALAAPAAVGLGTLMLGGVSMHLKVKDPLLKSIPALLLFAFCVAIFLLARFVKA